MVEIKVYSDIANHKEGIWMSMFGGKDLVFSADTVRTIFEEHKEETEFKFNIHCDGGSVSEGFAIYDIIRTSGKTIYTNIDGACHSMAIVLLLSAPLENRTANRNARSLIHPVMIAPNNWMNSDELRELADDVESEQNAILDIYEDRTGADRTMLESLMKEEKIRTANELLNYGFISEINNYTTNKFSIKMSKNKKKGSQSLLNRIANWTKGAQNLLEGAMNFDFEDADGNILFSTESEDDSLEVGMVASPDGTFDLPDGRVVTIKDGAITEIVPGSEEEEMENLRNENEGLRHSLTEASALINELKNQVHSNYNVRNRSRLPKSNKGRSTSSERKQEANEKRNKWKGNK